jgi:hypothetical protein
VWLLPGRAVWWPRGGALLVADVHLGKSASFRALGLPVPEGELGDDLARLGALQARTGAARLVVLGDLVHAAAGMAEGVVAEVAAWRAAAPFELWLVPGNHDAHVRTLPTSWRVRVTAPVHDEGPFRFVHAPAAGGEGAAYTWAGHVHPGVRIGRGRDAEVLPCFHLGPTLGILPAFGTFTGCARLAVGADEQAWFVLPR